MSGANPDGSSFSRQSSSTYDARGQFAISATNALGQAPAAPAVFDAKWGAILTRTDANGLSVSYQYDGFGRRVGETRPDGTSSSVTYTRCDGANPCPAMGNGVEPVHFITTRIHRHRRVQGVSRCV